MLCVVCWDGGGPGDGIGGVEQTTAHLGGGRGSKPCVLGLYDIYSH